MRLVPNIITHRTDGVIEITLTRGKTALIDAADYTLLKGRRWSARNNKNNWYAVSRTGGTHISMHRLLLPTKSPKIVDHKNGNGLDNRRSNLREATHSDNRHNARKKRGSSSLLAGVHYVKPWWAQIQIHGKRIGLGRFATEQEAHEAFLKAESKYYPNCRRMVDG